MHMLTRFEIISLSKFEMLNFKTLYLDTVYTYTRIYVAYSFLIIFSFFTIFITFHHVVFQYTS